MSGANEITSFSVRGVKYKVIGTFHALHRLELRGINKYHVASACLALGEKLKAYNNSGKQVIITDVSKGLSAIFCIEDFTIVLITVLDTATPHVKMNTVVESFRFA